MARWARRVDYNQNDIVTGIRGIGVKVKVTSACPELFDILCFWRGKTYPAEIKDGEKSPSRRRLTSAQIELHALAASAGVLIPIFEDVDMAIAYFMARQ